MKLVVDANILFSLAKGSSTASEISRLAKLQLFSSNFALQELFKYKEDLIKKSEFNSFESIISDLKQKVKFINESEYSEFLAKKEIKVSDPKDITYLALSLKLNCPVWSNDPHLKEQKLVPVFTTSELIELLFE